MAHLNMVYRDTAMLKVRARNPRTHSKKQLRQIAESINAFGFTNPILIDDSNFVVAGHGRLEAAKLIGLDEVPTIRLEELSQEEIRAYVITDNRLAERAGWDQEILAIEFRELMALDLDFDVTLTGFEMPEIDILIGTLGEDDEEDDEIPHFDSSKPVVTRAGDLWQIGDHRLFCGDSTKPEAYARLLEGDRAQMVFTDPPYNVEIAGNVSGKGAIKHQDFAMASGEMSETEFVDFLKAVFANLAGHSADGAIHFICMDWRHLAEILAASQSTFAELKNLCVWNKDNAGMGALYRSQHELVFVFKSGKGKHINNVQLGKHGRNRSNLWTYSGQTSFGKSRDEDLAHHPTVKPVALVADAIRDCSHRGGIVLDAFAGSGSTLLAAAQTGRKGYGIEIDPRYCDIIIDRLRQRRGLQAIHAESGRLFAEVQEERQRQLEAVS